jgi:hypothetical protein
VAEVEKLLPCPFCGSNNIGLSTGSWGNEDGFFDWIECYGCRTQQPPISEDDPDGYAKAIARWNTRTTIGGDK